ncbi:MAG: phosphoribosylformylglycinamidine synthase subunit PurL [Proteobacteria bacterium]|nr:phosphoribosylformylglycinamidine synthase subunit PurL [Pseudomonadota bacterium]
MIHGSDRTIDEALAAEHGLSAEEYAAILEHLGRTPTIEELGVFSVMWSEHCSYKSSRVHLKRFPVSGPAVLQGPGENAGAVDIGGGMAAIFKIESHNHPSYVEPYQGAATGVGGILRDIFTMGARPVANMNALFFGEPEDERTSYLLSGVVSGVGDYGNSVGVPTVGGQVNFDAAYNGNILVNAFSLGIARADNIFSAVASGEGNPVLYVGSRTGRDGVHGASLLASSEFKEESEQMKPTVQVGDPFAENLLIEACLEVLKGDDVVAIQDMGAAGLTSSSAEMAGRGGVGISLDLDKVPLRDSSVSPYEILLSESQERMLLVARQGRQGAVAELFSRWDLECVEVGVVTGDGRLRASWRGEEILSIPVAALTDDAPAYQRPIKEPATRPVSSGGVLGDGELCEPASVLLEMLACPELCSRRWVFEQYDSWVGANTVIHPGGDAAVIRVAETGAGLAMTVDCNPNYVASDPYLGAQHAIAEAVRNISVTGATPLAVSDCLNFGSPEKPEVMWQFSQAVDGMAAACRHFCTPVISGNVSFYNDTRGESIPPTPVIAMVGLMADSTTAVGCAAIGQGRRIYLLGGGVATLEGSVFERLYANNPVGGVPALDLDAEKDCSALCVDLVQQGLVTAAHDLSEGGLAVALAEMVVQEGSCGIVARVPDHGRLDSSMFGESATRILVVVEAGDTDAVEAAASASGVPCRLLGETGGDRFRLERDGETGERLLDLELAQLRAAREQTLPTIAAGLKDFEAA